MIYQSGMAGHYAVTARAMRAFGMLVRVNPEDFMTILSKNEKPLVVFTEKKFIVSSYHYLTSYKGFIFYTKTKSPMQLTSNVELIQAKSMWVSVYGN